MFGFLKKLFALDPKELFLSGEKFLLQGDFKNAINCYDKILDIDENNILALKKKTFILFCLEMYKEVIMGTDIILGIDPEDIEGLNWKGMALARQEKFTESIEYYDKALKINPANLESMSCKSISLYFCGKYEESIKCTEDILLINAGNSNTWTTRAMAMAGLGRLDESLDCYNRALAIEPKHIDALTGKGKVLYAQGKYEEGVKCQSEALELTSSLIPPLDPQVDTVPGATGIFAYDKTNPVPVCFQDGQIEYLSTLQCECGCPFDFHRAGSFGTCPDGHIIDGYELMCKNKKHHIMLYMDMYHEGPSSLLPKDLVRGKEKGTGLAFYVANFPEGLTEAIKEIERLKKK